jgi:predicted dehydrogenase
MKTYRFGIVGCGVVSKFHALSIDDLPNAALVACADKAPQPAQAFAEQYACDAHDDLDEMLARDDIDIVTVCTPSGAHLEPAIAAARAGKHVIVEKPLEITPERCDAIINACDDNKVQLAGIFPMRFTPGPKTLKAAIKAGRFGRITVGDAYNKWLRTQDYYDSGGWRGTWELDGGGAVMNQGVHAVDLIQWLMGPVTSVFAYADRLVRERIQVEDTCVAALRYESGAMGVIECTTSVYPGSERRIEVLGEKGTAILEDAFVTRWEFEDEAPEDARIREELRPSAEAKRGTSDPSNIEHSHFREEIRLILAALDGESVPPIDGREARRAVELITAMYRSAKSGQPVKLPL